ncbi:UDPGT domain-containing protein [Cephalotus follicularis]|uniref:Glycosyltransferase n=1 Tax=Cephalotus follicularis TaxID=3775 RepID=A0A1Q3D6W4_CEPFO|nr:UDPGT domain-containing protein [Cephalotus follicularis]
MLPFMAHGHLIPFLELARQLHQRTGFTITIANTPLNIQYLHSTMSTNPIPNIYLAELPFCSTDHGLPPNIENTENLTLDQIGCFFTSSQSLKTPFGDLLSDITKKQGRPPLCVISDVFFGWATDVAKRAGTLNISFTTGGAYGTLAYISIWLNLPHRKTDVEEFKIPGFPYRCRFHVSQLHRFVRAADGTDTWSKFMQPQISQSMRSFGWLCNTVEEIEMQALEWLRQYIKLPVWTIGPLLPPELLNNLASSSSSINRQRAGKKLGLSLERCIQWLDSRDIKSVVYISFGSQNSISPSQMMALAIGLEESNTPFIWVIRPPVGFDRKGEFRDEWLPEGFEARMIESKQGLLVKNWAPQLEILSHGSTGAFLSHCGWNSVMESLSQGVPIIGWPMAAEQFYNSKMLVEEMGVSVELTRGMHSCITREQVMEVIELVMDSKGKGEAMKKKAMVIKEQIRTAMKGEETGSSIDALDDFVRTIKESWVQ